MSENHCKHQLISIRFIGPALGLYIAGHSPVIPSPAVLTNDKRKRKMHGGAASALLDENVKKDFC